MTGGSKTVKYDDKLRPKDSLYQEYPKTHLNCNDNRRIDRGVNIAPPTFSAVSRSTENKLHVSVKQIWPLNSFITTLRFCDKMFLLQHFHWFKNICNNI